MIRSWGSDCHIGIYMRGKINPYKWGTYRNYSIFLRFPNDTLMVP